MFASKPTRVHELRELRDCAPVFRDRTHAGEVLAGMLKVFRGTDAIVLAIPAGGVPVAAEAARRLGLPLDVVPVSKILLPWTTEAGYGAVAFDGSRWVNEEAVHRYGLEAQEVERATRAALDKVERRLRRLRSERPFPPLADRTAILVDDGIAAGSTMRVALGALRRRNPGSVAVAVPTGHAQAVADIAREADALYCANLRGGWSFAVADAYEDWCDVEEDEVARILGDMAAAGPATPSRSGGSSSR